MPAASAAQAAESLLADGEDDRHRQRFRPGQGPPVTVTASAAIAAGSKGTDSAYHLIRLLV
jgi:hypothetical protein